MIQPLFIVMGLSFIPVFYLLGFTVVPSVALPLLMTWRYLIIRQDTLLKRNDTYLRIVCVLPIIIFIVLKDWEIILYAVLTLLILIAGFMLSHMNNMDARQKKSVLGTLSLYLGTLLAGGVGYLFLFDVVQYGVVNAWRLLTSTVIAIGKFILNPVEKPLDQLQEHIQENVDSEEKSLIPNREDRFESRQDSSIEEALPIIHIIFIGIGIALIILFIVRYSRQHWSQKQQSFSDGVTYEDIDFNDKGKNRSSWSDSIRNKYLKRRHPVRKKVHNLEKQAVRTEYKRYRFETIEEWLTRIGFHDDLAVYQHVRYGEEDVSESAIARFDKKLDDLLTLLKK